MNSEQFLEPTAETKTAASLFGSYKLDTRSERRKFNEEAFTTINTERKGTKYKPMTERQIALMINKMAPKGCPDSFIVDVRKACQVEKQKGKSYGQVFWALYHKAK